MVRDCALKQVKYHQINGSQLCHVTYVKQSAQRHQITARPAD